MSDNFNTSSEISNKHLYPQEIEKPGPKGIGGWLILPAIGIFLGPLINIYNIIQVFNIMSTHYYDNIISKFSGFDLLLAYEIVINFGLIIVTIFIGFIFFNKNAITPKVYIVVLSTTLALSFIELIWASAIFEGRFEMITFISGSWMIWVDSSGFLFTFFRSIAASCIWIPYFLKSKRVKNTFVN